MRNTLLLALSVAAATLLAGCSTATAPPSPESPPTESSPSASPSAGEPSSAPNSTAPDSSESFTAGAPDGQCRTANLTVSLGNEGSAAGHIHYAVTFTNTGETCVLEGFPTVQVTGGGSPIGVAATEDSGTAAQAISLTRGGTTSAELTVTNIASGGGPLGDACTVGHGDAFAVTPPHSTTAISVPMPNIPACSNGAQWMTVGPVVNFGTT